MTLASAGTTLDAPVFHVEPGASSSWGRAVVLCGAPGIPAAGPSGASAHLRGVADALGAVAIVTPRRTDGRGPSPDTLPCAHVETGVPWWPRMLGRWRDLQEVAAGRRVAAAVRDLAPELLWERHALYSDAGMRAHAALAARGQHTRWVLEVNAPPARERARWEELRQPAWADRWERTVMEAAPCVVAVSRWLADWCTERGARNVRWVPNGVAVHDGGDRDHTRSTLGIAEDVELLGFLGSGRAWHGVEALAGLLEARPHARALLVGDASLAHPRAVNLGRVTEARAAALVAAMDVLVAPYTDDAPPWLCPLKVLHARAQGTPVVARGVGDVDHLLGEDGGTALPRWSTRDACEALDAWRGRRAPKRVRGWSTVVAEALADTEPAATPRPGS